MSVETLKKKKQQVADLKIKIEKAKVLVLSDYRTFNVQEITELRKSLYKDQSELRVFKNTILEKALKECGIESFAEHLHGPTAVLFGYGDPVLPLKSLVEFFKDIEKGAVKAGVVEGSVVDNKQLTVIAKLPTREVLLAKVVGSLQAPISGFVRVLQGPINKLVYALSAIKDAKGNN
ncbi:50S ribosomal protein L10 [candidate division WOR-1 bacterium RIFOXYB2_FULL_42_35]|uniref:Large ribosomal subunit protein uL10 n=1 Tax=candidate division WOR-1 bacterium RIFOXYC2_FULL_41_25 TaxID=1802586 RepID=A0A1F4TNS1_UNCSA|nr:MAG: 50S ribosomal protein L10 [candidate division WOR-1 bacterium RIFOXYA2_FULL_41_14]OGC23848.1 MAG: 50S ribosomal protein L10 [candidate division WOR-1 bacterium RIFOXYB2_FULL_42_35]OGC33723.1 MAG: 50S ribosomal protein L10 [candidate division WOR-1 bacterium RIFOXYC2_FULL_41_25]